MAELIDNVTGYQTIALLGEHSGNVEVLLAALPHVDIAKISQQLSPDFLKLSLTLGSHLYQCTKVLLENTTLEQAESKLLAAVL